MAHPRNALASALDFGFQRDTPRQGNKYESISRQPPYRRMTRRRGTPPGRAHQGHPRQRSRVAPSTSRRLGALQLPVGWPVVVASPSPRQANRSPRSSSRSHPDPSTLSSVTHCPAGSSAALGTAPTVSSPHPPACVRAPAPPHDMLSGFDHVDPTPVVSAWGWRVRGPRGVCRRRPPHSREGQRSPLYAVDSLPPPFSHVYRGLTRRPGGCWLARGPDPPKRRGLCFFGRVGHAQLRADIWVRTDVSHWLKTLHYTKKKRRETRQTGTNGYLETDWRKRNRGPLYHKKRYELSSFMRVFLCPELLCFTLLHGVASQTSANRYS